MQNTISYLPPFDFRVKCNLDMTLWKCKRFIYMRSLSGLLCFVKSASCYSFRAILGIYFFSFLQYHIKTKSIKSHLIYFQEWSAKADIDLKVSWKRKATRW